MSSNPDSKLLDPMLGEDKTGADCYCGLKADCRKWIQWRSLGSNRAPWKVVCSLLLVGEMSIYFYFARSTTLWFMGIVFVIKYLIETWGQDTPTWVCPGSYFVFIMIYVFIIPTLVSIYGYCTCVADIDFAYRDAAAVVLYMFGSLFSLSYELHRFWWKSKPENKGKLHTVMLASYCIHPNYFGDLFTYSGWALAAGTLCALSIPALMLGSFVLIVIPNSDKYLAERYPKEFPAYAQSTATLIPFIRSGFVMLAVAWTSLVVGMYGQCTQCSAPCGI